MATTAGAKKGLWSTIRRIAASDRISGLIMLGFALTGLVLANLPATAHAFETVAETHLFIPYTNLDLPIGHWAQDGLLTIVFLTVGLELKQELTTGSLANPKAAAVPMLCAVGGMIAPATRPYCQPQTKPHSSAGMCMGLSMAPNWGICPVKNGSR